MDLSLGNFGILIEEQDGNPSGFCTKLIASNASLTNNGDGSFTLTTGGGVSDHGALTGKSDDDHTQYGLLAGRSGGQTLKGGIDASDGLILQSTNHATKGLITLGSTLYIDEVNNRVGIGENAPTADFEINSTGGENVYIYRYGNVAGPPSIKYWKARGTEGSPSKLQAGDDTGKFEFWGYVRNAADDGDAFLRTGYIVSEVESVDAQERSKGRISFYVKTGYAVTNPDIMASIEPDGFLVEKIDTATVGTQYESWDLKMKCSVWDETNVQAEDRVMYWTLNAGSGVDGSEPYYLSLYDNGGTEIMRIDPMSAVAPAILISDYILHLGDTNTGFRFQADRVTLYAGGPIMIDAIEGAQDILYLGHDGSSDIDVSIGPNGCLFVEGSSCDIIVYKSGTATVGTQYDSYDFDLRCSVWDETNIQAEDRNITLRNVGGSGVDGSEPYYLSLCDNGGTEIMRIDPLTPAILIPDYLTHLGDLNTSIYFRTDRVTIYAGGRVMIDALEASPSQDILYLGHDGSSDIDVSIGPSGALFVQGDTKRISFQQTGTIQLFTYEGTVNDDVYFDLPDAVAGLGMANFNEGAEYAIFSFTDAGAVTLISNSANVANSQSDGNYCIYDSGGTAVRIENKIGSNVNIKVFVWFN